MHKTPTLLIGRRWLLYGTGLAFLALFMINVEPTQLCPVCRVSIPLSNLKSHARLTGQCAAAATVNGINASVAQFTASLGPFDVTEPQQQQPQLQDAGDEPAAAIDHDAAHMASDTLADTGGTSLEQQFMQEVDIPQGQEAFQLAAAELHPFNQTPSVADLSQQDVFVLGVDAFLIERLTGADFDRMCQMYNKNPGMVYRPSARTRSGVMHNVTQGVQIPGFTSLDIRQVGGFSGPTHQSPYMLQVRDNIDIVLQQLLLKCPLPLPGDGTQTFAKHAREVIVDGQRVVNELWTADLWLNAQSKMTQIHRGDPAGDKPILWLVLWSDKTTYDKATGQLCHCLTASIGNTCVEFQHSIAGQCLIALLPVLPDRKGSETAAEFSERRAAVLQAAMGVVADRLKTVCATPQLVHWPDGTSDVCCVKAAMYLADLQEAWDLTCLKQNSKRPDIMTLVRKNQISDVQPVEAYAVRTEEQHKEAVELHQAGLRNGSNAGAEYLKQLSMKPVPKVALWGMFDKGLYTSFPPDVLHQDHNGMQKHLWECVEQRLVEILGSQAAKDRLLGVLNEQLLKLRPLHEAYFPTLGLAASKMTAMERKGLMQFLPFALYGLVPDNITHVLAEYAHWQHLRDAHTHTTNSLAKLHDMTLRLSRLILDTFQGIKDFDFPKFFNMRKYPAAIREFGTICIADTGPREAYIKELRKAWNMTRRQPNTIGFDVASKVAEREAIAAGRAAIAAASAATSAPQKPVGTGVRQRAAASWEQTMSATGRWFTFSNMRVDGTWESSVLEQVEGVTHLQDALTTWLEGDACPASIYMGRCIAVPRRDPIVDVLYAHHAYFDREEHNLELGDAAYQAVAGGVEGTYYAQVIAMGEVRPPQGAVKQFVFCKGYEKVSSPELNPLNMQPLKWEATPHPAAPINKKARKVNTVPGHFFILDPQALKSQVCIVPNFKLGDGHFFINPLVHEAEEHLAAVRANVSSS